MKKLYVLLTMALFSSATWAQTPCAAPEGATVNPQYVEPTMAYIDWTSDSAMYVVQYKEATAKEWIIDSTYDGEGYFTMSDLTESTNYVAMVRISCGNGVYSTWSDTMKFATPKAPECITPANLAATAIGLDSAVISFVSTFESQYLYYKTDAETEWTEKLVFESPYTLSDLTPGTKYSIKIVAVCSFDWNTFKETLSDTSAIVNFATKGGAIDTTHVTDTTGTGNDTTGTSINNNYNLNINVYSADNQIIITNNTEKINEVVVMNMMGAEVARYNVNKVGNATINANIAEGNYIIKVIADKKIGAYKVFVR